MSREDFGTFLEKATTRGLKRESVFLKPHPTTITQEHKVFRTTKKTIDEYTVAFNDWGQVKAIDEEILRKFHPHFELMGANITLTSSTSSSETPFHSTPVASSQGSLSRQTSIASAATVSTIFDESADETSAPIVPSDALTQRDTPVASETTAPNIMPVGETVSQQSNTDDLPETLVQATTQTIPQVSAQEVEEEILEAVREARAENARE